MNNFLKSFKENLLTNITLIVVLACTLTHLLLITLNVFGITAIKFYDKFNYLVAYIFICVSLCIFILGFWITKITKLQIPQWFQVVFYIAFFVFTNTYYITNAYNSLGAMLFFYMYLSFISIIANVSVFYNVQKDEKNKLKASKAYILTSLFFYSTGTNAIIMFIVSLVKCIFFPLHTFTDLAFFVVEFLAMMIVTIAMTIAYGISLAHSKSLINGCLIKTNKQ